MRERNRVVTWLPGYTAQMMSDYLIVPGDPPWTTGVPFPIETGLPSTKEQYCRDEVIPRWKERIANGEIINNAFFRESLITTQPQKTGLSMSIQRQDWDGKKGHKRYGTVVPFAYYGNRPSLLPHTAEVDDLRSSVYDRALTQAHARVDPALILAGATLAEGNKTIRSMIDITKRATRIARAVRKLDVAMARNVWNQNRKSARKIRQSTGVLKQELSRDAILNDYMQARYAIRPLIYDVNGIIDVLHAPIGDVRKTARGYAEEYVTSSDILHSVPFWHDVIVDLKRTTSVRISARAGVLYNVDRQWANLMGCQKLGETAYELFPFSFIFDWIWNVGATIAAHAPKAGVNQLASWITAREDWVAVNTMESARLTPEVERDWSDRNLSVQGFYYGETQSRVNRVVDPLLRTWPRFDVNLSAYKLLDLGIILKGFIR